MTDTANAVDEHIDYESDPEDLDHSELREIWQNVYDLLIDGPPVDYDVESRLWDRRREIWDEMESRTDAEPPECPSCGAQSWSQEFGGPKSCQCGYHPEAYEHDLVNGIDEYWSLVKSGPQEVAD